MTPFVPSSHSYACVSYGDPGGGGGSITSTQAVARRSSGAIDAGTYSDTDGYSYKVGASSIVIYKKSGAVWKTITPNDALWDTIVSNLTKDYASGRLRSGMATPRVSTSGSSSAVDEGPALAQDPFYRKPWFPVAVLGGVTAIGLLTYALWPSKA